MKEIKRETPHDQIKKVDEPPGVYTSESPLRQLARLVVQDIIAEMNIRKEWVEKSCRG